MSGPQPDPVEQDSRGILDPWLMRRRVQLTRYPVGPALAGLVDRFWAVEWDLAPDTEHTQQVLTHPAANFSIGHADGHSGEGHVGQLEARLNGVARSLTTRTLTGRGWAVAAMTTPGGLGAFVTEAASVFSDRVIPLGQVLGADEASLIEETSAQPDQEARAGVLASALENQIAGADPQRVRNARQVAEIAGLAETDRSLRQLGDLCAATGLGPRKLQRMFLEYAGVPPTWVLRRYRLLDAAEAVRAGAPMSWAGLAADLGYADQAHLIRDFRAATGQTPAAYAESQSAGQPGSAANPKPGYSA